jgi:predicted ester cyclase
MSNESIKQLARRTMEELDHRNVDGVLAHCAPDAVWHGFAPTTLDNPGYRQAIGQILSAFPDSRFPVDDVVGDGDRVTVRHSLRGTHLAPFQAIAATGKPVQVSAMITFHVADGRIVEAWLNADMFGLMQQLGVTGA